MDPERVQEQAAEALSFIQTVHEILPGWVQVGGLALIGLACIGGAYALWRMFSARRQRKRLESDWEEMRLARLVESCDTCGDVLHGPYFSWHDFLADVKNMSVSIEHILARCAGAAPKKPPLPEDVMELRIAARVARERERIYAGGPVPCPPCREML